MAKITGFLEFHREKPARRPVDERLKDWNEFEGTFESEKLNDQAARCMDCGIPFCHSGCPLGNLIPDWNDFIWRERWEQAGQRLHSTNNFPEMTGRICPAPCEEACTLNIDRQPVNIKLVERQIADWALANGHLEPQVAEQKTGKKIAVVGSGPAGMACAQQLARAGHSPTVFERDDRIGGLLRYGIPNFKLEKHFIDARIKQMEAEGVTFRPSTNVGVDVTAAELQRDFDAIVLSGGATLPRDLPLPGRELKGVHFAMDFLRPQNKICEGDAVADAISAKDKRVIVLGGGDTGSDCVGTSNRHGAASVHQFELMPRPPDERATDQPWPYWPMIMRTSSSHEEGAERDFSINTVRFSGDAEGNVSKLHAVRLRWVIDEHGRRRMEEIEGSQFELGADLVLLALGFLGPEKGALLTDLGVEFTERGAVKAGEDYRTSVEGVFACGDLRRGQSLVVWAIWEGRECACHVDAMLRDGDGDLLSNPNPAPLVL
ncbi:MAG: glutamate synthase subunit beta [Myxococcales bacterium]|nr:glutamate synthase subunit beta [Myxococcales bacterium]